MPGLYTHTPRNDGESITDTIYNEDHQNHINNHIPTKVDDYSASAAEMQTETDPGEDGSESLATSLAGELERLRFAISELKGTTYWYESAASNLGQLDRHNFLINGDFSVWQRGTSFTAVTTVANDDNTLVADGWRLLSDGDDIVDITRTTEGPSEADTSLTADIETANKKWGLCQFVEGKDSIKLTQGSQKVALNFYAKSSSGAAANRLRAAVIEWTGTEDAPTTDIVSSWGAEGVNPTLVANWAYVSTPTTLTLTSTLTKFSITNIELSDSATNVGVFIWMDDITTTVGNLITLAAVQLVRGVRAGIYPAEPWINTLLRCQRRFAKTFPYATTPILNAGQDGALTVRANADGAFNFDWRLPVEMMAIPTLVTYNPSGLNTSARNATDNTDTATTGSALNTSAIRINKGTSGASDAGDVMMIHALATVDF